MTRAELERARALREAIDAAVVAATAGRALPAGTGAALAAVLDAAPPSETVAVADGVVVTQTARGGTPAAQALAAIALDAADMLGAGGAGAHPHLRVADVQRPLLRPVPGRPPPLVFDAGVRQCGEGPPAPPPGP